MFLYWTAFAACFTIASRKSPRILRNRPTITFVVCNRSNILPAGGASKDAFLRACWRRGLLKKTMQGLFFTGTDTGVGKTLITVAVARILRGHGHAVRFGKPVATGASWVRGRWLSDDTRRLAEAEGNLEA